MIIARSTGRPCHVLHHGEIRAASRYPRAIRQFASMYCVGPNVETRLAAAMRQSRDRILRAARRTRSGASCRAAGNGAARVCIDASLLLPAQYAMVWLCVCARGSAMSDSWLPASRHARHAVTQAVGNVGAGLMFALPHAIPRRASYTTPCGSGEIQTRKIERRRRQRRFHLPDAHARCINQIDVSGGLPHHW